uniref:Uncharacterized protein n=1 Tax=Anopheles minimus TaxID=112268 RepID=A0A182WCT3_9DIPT
MASYTVTMEDYFAATGEDCRAYYFVCNYSFINLKHRATYTSGVKPATMCQSRHSEQYPCLCSVHEPYSTVFDWPDQVINPPPAPLPVSYPRKKGTETVDGS